jgi:type IV secretory pathway VirB2 component (pilin)
MSTSKIKMNIFRKIMFCFVFLVLLISLFLPFSTTLATGETATLERVACNKNGQNNNWSWVLKATTTNIANNTELQFYLLEGTNFVSEGEKKISVQNNSVEYHTGSILYSNTEYMVSVQIVGMSKVLATYTEKTPKETETMCGDPTPPATTNGWYFIYKKKYPDSPNYYFVVSSVSVDEASCKTKREEWLKNEPTAVLFKDCLYYESKPERPPDIEIDTSAETDTTYTPLVSLPGISGLEKGVPFETDPIKNPCPFGKYLNIIIKLFFGIAGVLAVVMIVMGGIQYMTSELISSKEEGKNTIVHAILGLLLALGAWLILNAINPDLLNVCLNNLPKATIVIEDEVETTDMAEVQQAQNIPSGGTLGCKEGVVKVSTTNGGDFYLCKTISENAKKMINLAWQKDIKLSGGSFRSTKRQEELRSKNCGGDSNIYNEKAKCTPLTAYPGRSRHESGLAIDFKCEEGGKKVLIQNTTNACFVWLKANAGTYGLKNLKTGTEPWHWSIDGK